MKSILTSKSAAFSLLELLVSITVGTILISMVAMMTSTGSQMTTRIQSSLLARRDGKVALDYFERDLSAITQPRIDRSTLSLVPEEIFGPNSHQANSIWLMFLSRPATSSGSGSIKAISYRLVYTDPMTPNGSAPRYAIYRTQISPEANSDNSFLRAPNLHDDYWKERWPQYKAQTGGHALLNDFLLEGVVDFKATVNYAYDEYSIANDPTSEKVRKFDSRPVTESISWTKEGFTGDDDIPTPNIPMSITLTLTTLNIHDIELFKDGAVTFKEIVNKEGVTISRTVPIVFSP